MANVTINDIARMAKISPAAVSYVINNRPGVSEETRRRVLDIIDKTNYSPNLNSRKLVLNKSFNIHIVISNTAASFDNLFYNAAITRMTELCARHGYNSVLSNIMEDFNKSALSRSIDQKDVDGVIFLQTAVPSAAKKLQAADIPYVVLDPHDAVMNYSSVYCDYYETAYAATSFLIGKGHRHIAFFGMGAIHEFYDSSSRGYMAAMQEHDFSFSQKWLFGNTSRQSDISACVNTLLDTCPEVTAVLCATDVIAVNFMKCVIRRGISVPEKLSVCGMDNVLIAQYCTPSLTTVDIDKEKMGTDAVKLLFEMINDDALPQNKNICIHAKKIVERESVMSLD